MPIKLPKLIATIVAIPIVTALIMFPIVVKAHSTMKHDKDLAGEIDQLLAGTFQPDAPGAAVIVVRDGHVILRKGYGLANLELGVPVKPEMVFRLASVAKQFTALAILMLSEEGKLALTDDVTQYLPGYPTHGQTVTIENLLTHTGGIKEYELLPARLALSRNDLTPEELIALFQDEPLDFAPGEQWAYSNSGYVLLGAIIETVSGMRYAEFIQQRIFTPLGMEHSYYDDTTHIIPGRVAGYAPTADGYANAAYMSMTQAYAAGALASSVDDLARWDAALYTGELVKQRTLRRAFQAYSLENGQSTGYGYGWVIGNYAGHTIAQHNGGINGFSTQVMRLPDDKVYIAILSNGESRAPVLGSLAFQIATLVIGKPYHDPTAITLPTATLARYEGVYQFNPQTRIVVRRDGDQLLLPLGGQSQVLVPLSSTEFFIRGVPLRIRFVEDADGAVTGLQLQQNFSAWFVAVKSDEPLPATRVPAQVDPALYTQYVGEYQLAPGLTLTVSTEEENLFGQVSGEAKVGLLPESESKFFLVEADVQIEFTRDAAGNVTGLVLYQSGQEIPGRKVK